MTTKTDAEKPVTPVATAPVADQVSDKKVEKVEAVAAKVADDTKTEAKITAKPAKPAAKKTPVKKAATAKKAARKATKPVKKSTKKITPKAKAAAKKAAPTATKKGFNMFNFDNAKWTEGLEMGTEKFEAMIGEAQARQEELVKKSQKAAEELAELTRANIEAIVESGRIAAQGTKDLSGTLIEDGRTGMEKQADVAKKLAEAKSPTEFFQLQADFMQTAFDNMIQESSKLTEKMIKLQSDAMQPVSNQASVAADKVKALMA
ncbi:phasin family protein [Sphingomicrobium marinum]|uniref:phasin family protein n=1 Tax=Sphingomicrobium marinum TaxID=1227950 RepID=UPI00223FD692|nr:phasin family protein [Sphingomicrobium marinum]